MQRKSPMPGENFGKMGIHTGDIFIRKDFQTKEAGTQEFRSRPYRTIRTKGPIKSFSCGVRKEDTKQW